MQTLENYAAENPVRYRMIAESIAQLVNAKQEITEATLSDTLPKDFGLDANDPFRAMAAAALRGDVAAVVEPVTAAPESPKEDRNELAARLLDAQKRAADLRGVVMHYETERANARARFADELQMWLHGRPRLSAEANAREYIRASIADRAERFVPDHPISGPSNLDRELQRYGGADAFAKKRMRVGPHRGRGVATGAAIPSYRPNRKGETLPRGDS